MSNALISPHNKTFDYNLHEKGTQTSSSPSEFPFDKFPETNNDYFTKLNESAQSNIKSGNLNQALVNFDECINYLIQQLDQGINSSALLDYISFITNHLNDIALTFLKNDKPLLSLKLLNKCKEYTDPQKFGLFPKLRGFTYNHIACCFRRLGNLENALLYLQKTLDFTEGRDQAEVLGITHINLCAVLSQMNK